MYLSMVLPGFKTVATAIDTFLWTNTDCSGVGVGCPNMDPKVCCAINNDHHASATWQAIPLTRHINVGAYRQNNCEVLVASCDSNDQATVCVGASGRILTGARYHFRNNKRADDSCDASWATEEVQQPCERHVAPTRLVLVEGSSYNIEGLEKDHVDTLLSLAYNGSTSADLPELYTNLAVEE
ncbi:hypothetical protein EK21DRAFT_110821 [Setomelanomma holmii]|uniref:Uncharacterized protein n=1 Tax=Setomelanomma holmii TaxID=210430 RepID=A0A9P4HAN1_9PLEO|nr:hypothetical protein EK21DRAFT_110821 [Setomelanomma holmii]